MNHEDPTPNLDSADSPVATEEGSPAGEPVYPYTPDVAYDPAVHGPFQPGQHPDLDARAIADGFKCCASCGRLPVTHWRARYYSNKPETEYDNVLIMRFEPGYGLFFDATSDEGPFRAILCHDCAHTLCDQQPWLAAILDPGRGSIAATHSHSTAYYDAHPEHYGWDYDAEWAHQG